jgi:ribulose-bisphosphate carboxylase large chain
MSDVSLRASLSGERLRVDYLLTGDEGEARGKADDICLEQTVEFPGDLVPPGAIRELVVGRVEAFGPAGGGRFRATISFAVETTAFDLVQLLNVLFGNISIKPGIRLEALALPPSFLARLPGPRHGRSGLRALLAVPTRPLVCTALKPMGLDAPELADLAHRCALGGIDLIKDDHGLTDQPFCPFEERVARCAEAVARANARTGRACRYMANVTGPADQVLALAHRAKALGAGALLLAPSLVGFDTLRALAADETLGLPIMAHPAFGGSLVTSAENGIAHGVLYGQLMRLCGADLTVYPNYGGRFSFTREECVEIARATAAPLGALRESFPAPGGGMTSDRVADMRAVYGREFAFLVGGGLHRRSADLVSNARHFVDLLEAM